MMDGASPNFLLPVEDSWLGACTLGRAHCEGGPVRDRPSVDGASRDGAWLVACPEAYYDRQRAPR